jgi:hypothetical protein
MGGGKGATPIIRTLMITSCACGTHPVLPMTADGYVINLGERGTICPASSPMSPPLFCPLIGLAITVWTRRAGSFDTLLIGLHVS